MRLAEAIARRKAAATAEAKTVASEWQPQPKQEELLRVCGLLDALYGGPVHPALADWIGYGGAAFGGKTEGAVAVALTAAHCVPGVQVGYFRRMFTELEGADGPIDRSIALYPKFGGRYNASKHVWRFPNGAMVHFCHCNYDKDRFNYQSQAFDILIFDEATHFSRVIAEYLVHTRNRPSKESQLPKPFFVGPTNPGNIGMMWYMEWFDILKTQGEHMQVKEVQGRDGKPARTIFLPSLVSDNPIGLAKDPDYPERLKRTDASTANALLNGDWKAFAGQAFPQFAYETHTCIDFHVPEGWPKWRAADYGFTHPFFAAWLTSNPANGRIYVYRTVKGVQWTDTQQAEMIKQMTPVTERVTMTFAGHDYWTKHGLDDLATDHATIYSQHQVPLTKADIDRKSGKGKIDRLLALREDGQPGIQFFRQAARDMIDVIPLLVLDESDPEDVKKMDGDDGYDTLRYGLTSIRDPKKEEKKNKEQSGWKVPY